MENKKKIIVIEMAKNQLEQDIRRVNEGRLPIISFNKLGGAIFNEMEMADFISENL